MSRQATLLSGPLGKLPRRHSMTICSLTLDQVTLTGSGHTLAPPLETRRSRTPHLPLLDLPRPPRLPAQGSSRVQLRWRTRTSRGGPHRVVLWTSGGPTSSPPPHRRSSCWSCRWVGVLQLVCMCMPVGLSVLVTHVWRLSSVSALTQRVSSPLGDVRCILSVYSLLAHHQHIELGSRLWSAVFLGWQTPEFPKSTPSKSG